MNGFFQKILFIMFFIQGLIPVGYMPAFANDNFTIVICSGVTGEKIEIQQDNPHQNDSSQSQCPYVGVGSWASTELPKIPLVDASIILLNNVIDATVTIDLFISTNQTRGPPSIFLI